MKGKIYEDCVSYMKTTPFEITINSKIYSGTLTESGTSVGGLEAVSEYEIEWEDEVPKGLFLDVYQARRML